MKTILNKHLKPRICTFIVMYVVTSIVCMFITLDLSYLYITEWGMGLRIAFVIGYLTITIMQYEVARLAREDARTRRIYY